ncbi:MAG: hypothetical protein DYH08_12845 [Actinobacteria bacterium ATB1]|nr:hypothetical protein [Actinobacteria bacterium ATB1]
MAACPHCRRREAHRRLCGRGRCGPGRSAAGTRVIVRREQAHPGTQLKLRDSGPWRYQCVITNQTGGCVTLETQHRAHARVENHIEALEDSGLERFPCIAWAANEAWFACVLAARILTCWLALSHPRWRPHHSDTCDAALYRLLHMPGRIVSDCRPTLMSAPRPSLALDR